MRKVRFELSSHYVGGAELEEIFEFPDGTTDEEIQKEFDIWVAENTTQDTNWSEIQ